MNGPLVIAFDDQPHEDAAGRLADHLHARGRPTVTLPIHCGLNDSMIHSKDWPTKLEGVIDKMRTANGLHFAPSW